MEDLGLFFSVDVDEFGKVRGCVDVDVCVLVVACGELRACSCARVSVPV